MNKKFLIFLIFLKTNLVAENEILSFVCVKRFNTQPGEQASALSSEFLSSTLKDLNVELASSSNSDPKKIKKDYLSEYLDEKIYRIEYGTDLKARSDLRKNYTEFSEKITKISKTTSDEEKKQDFEDLKILTYSYQILSRGKLSLSEEFRLKPFWIEEAQEAIAQVVNAKPFIYGKTLDLLQFSGGYGNCYRELPTAFGGMNLTDFLKLCITLNNGVKNILSRSGGLLVQFKKSCSLINATADEGWERQKLNYSVDVQDEEVSKDVTLPTIGGVIQKTFEDIRGNLERFKCQATEDLKLTANTIYLNAAWSSSVMPVFVPMLQDRGIMIGVISTPNDNDSSTDITDKLYSKEKIQKNDIVAAFFEWYDKSAMLTPNTNSGFCHYIFLKKIGEGLMVHYFLDSKLTNFVTGLKKREESNQENILNNENFPGLKEFNENFNKNADALIERIYIWWCCWHAPITTEVKKQATDEALKVKSLLSFFKTNGIVFKLHTSFEEFKKAALCLFEENVYKPAKLK